MEADLPAIVEIYNSTVPTRMVTADTEPVSVESRRTWFREHDPGRYLIWVGLVLAFCDIVSSSLLAGSLFVPLFPPRGFGVFNLP